MRESIMHVGYSHPHSYLQIASQAEVLGRKLYGINLAKIILLHQIHRII